jgi:hypothetical protein
VFEGAYTDALAKIIESNGEEKPLVGCSGAGAAGQEDDSEVDHEEDGHPSSCSA